MEVPEPGGRFARRGVGRRAIAASARRLVTAIGLLLALAVPPAAGTGTCGPSPAGSPCASLGATGLAGDGAVPPLAGNPVHLASGNKLLTEVDLPPLPGPLGLEIVRHYNSVHAGPGVPPTAIGRGWRLSYDVELAAIGATVQVLTADGRRLVFRRDPAEPATCAGDDPAHGRLVARRTAAGERFDWHRPDGRRLAFDERGRLVQVALATGEALDLQRDAAGRLVRAVDPAGRVLVFGWAPADTPGFRGIAWIDSPVGRFTFRHGGPAGESQLATLVAVTRPAADGATVERRYHHEDARFPTLLTGVGVHGPDGLGGTTTRRLATYRHGDDGRAVETLVGDAADPIHRVAIDRSRPGETRLTDAAGRVTTVRHAVIGGRVVVTGTRGPGCALCPPSPMDFVHDADGRVVAEVALDDAGRPLRSRRIVRDALGRAVEARLLAHDGASAGAVRELSVERMDYAGLAWEPVRIARRSVVAGREHVVELERDAEGRLLRWVEAGFAPIDADGRPLPIDADGRVPAAFATAATPLRRETRFVHADVGGRLRLVAIDGPLPNGPTGSPADSDVTRLQWDARGERVVRVERPGGDAVTLSHDAAGRLVRAAGPTGVTQWTLDPASGRAVEIARSLAGDGGTTELLRWQLDAAGDPVAQQAGWRTASGWHADADARQWRAGWDAAGRLRWRVDAFGGVLRRRFDADGRLVEERRAAGRIAAVRRFVQDGDGRLAAVLDGDGMAVGGGDDAPDGEPGAAAPAWPGPSPLRRLVDDFGREVARIGADHGTRVDRHDEADRLVERREADGSVWRWTYDPAGRLQSRTVTGTDGRVATTRWTWDGGRLVATDDPVQRERLRHDAAGRVVERRVTVTGPDGATGATAVQRWRYDAFGRVAGWTLADGSWLLVRRNGQGQVVALHRQRLETAWLRPLLPDQPLLAGLERDGVGLARAVHGNGLATHRLRSADGALVRGWLAPAVTTPVLSAHGPSVDRVAALLGLAPAVARPAGPSPARTAAEALVDASSSPAPGWIGRPADPSARLDDRYLWDRAGNLLRRESRGEGGAVQRSYLHDAQDQLLQVVARAVDDGRVVGGERHAWDTAATRQVSQWLQPAPVAPAAAPDLRHPVSTPAPLPTEPPPAAALRVAVDAASPHRPRRVATEPPDALPLAGDWHHDAAGRLVSAGDRRFGWDLHGQLATVHQGDRRLVAQAANHRGERVRRTGADGLTAYHLHDDRRRWADIGTDGRLHRQWVWLADLPVAVIDPVDAVQAADADEPAPLRDLRRLWRAARGGGDRIAHLHADHLGAPVLATGDDGRTLWRAELDAFGRARTVAVEPGFALDLRLPGQHEDPDTGLHHNDHRTYDPATGRYLSPDPLGTPDGPNPYAYAGNAPHRHVDPSGLILFAFDGTDAAPGTRTNVWHFASAYDDLSAFDRASGYTGTSFYEAGVGGARGLASSAVANDFGEIVAAQENRFRQYVQRHVDWHLTRTGASRLGRVRITLDVVGYSRGAAAAREFSHRVAQMRRDHFARLYGDCVTVLQRLLAMFDTVLGQHRGDPRMATGTVRLAVPPDVQLALHAVALNEHRQAFALESIAVDPSGLVRGDPRRIERGFLGAHADVGGDHGAAGRNGAGRPDLSDLALQWAVQQARAAGVAMRPLPPELRQVTSPVVADSRRRPLWRFTGDLRAAGDREVRFHRPTERGTPAPPAATGMQARLQWAHGMGSDAARRFVVPTRPGVFDERIGLADLCAYLDWLRTHYRMEIDPHAGCS